MKRLITYLLAKKYVDRYLSRNTFLVTENINTGFETYRTAAMLTRPVSLWSKKKQFLFCNPRNYGHWRSFRPHSSGLSLNSCFAHSQSFLWLAPCFAANFRYTVFEQ